MEDQEETIQQLLGKIKFTPEVSERVHIAYKKAMANSAETIKKHDEHMKVLVEVNKELDRQLISAMKKANLSRTIVSILCVIAVVYDNLNHTTNQFTLLYCFFIGFEII